ncbi:tyrosine-protein phosphatase [Peribacillus kribbensis]|uniref:tyrosine-protein phosphatase n=1 Tax=Peribacillus kribbensis TaxID=356658 RepID=UPI0003FD230C|nr:CpsB/CapC family capsule biosynthesis tyrosine phosphatase [Peribacillus kribbensis]
MIDLHSHILPGIDDGAQIVSDSIELAKAAVEEGIQTLFATPHHMNGAYENTKETILKKVDQLKQTLYEHNIPLEILPGQEVRIYGNLVEDYEAGNILTLNDEGIYLLVELPSGHVPRYTEKLLFDIQLQGIAPIIVHPERNQELIERPELLLKFVEKGALSQVTAASIAGMFGKKIKKFSLDLIEANLTHFIASDAHNLRGRSFKMTDAFDVVKKEFGNDLVYLFKENAQLLTDGKVVYREAPQPVKRKKILGIF